MNVGRKNKRKSAVGEIHIHRDPTMILQWRGTNGDDGDTGRDLTDMLGVSSFGTKTMTHCLSYLRAPTLHIITHYT